MQRFTPLLADAAHGLGSLLTVLPGADPRDKAELCSWIGLRMTRKPGPKTDLGRVPNVCARIDTADTHTVTESRELKCSG